MLPLVAIFVNGDLIAGLRSEEARQSLWLSLQTSLVSLAIMVVFGTPIAHLLATRQFRGRTLVLTAFELPLVLPPAVAGLGLLMAFGRKGLLGEELNALGLQIPFTKVAVVMAMTFVASPLYVRQAIAAFEAVDRTLLDASRTLGAGSARTFWRVIPARLPAKMIVAPNSPTARAQPSAAPAPSPVRASGTATRQNVRADPAPSVRDASSSVRSTASNAAIACRT